MITDLLAPSKMHISIEGVAEKLVQLCRQNRRTHAINELYSDKITRIELKAGKVGKTEGKLDVLKRISEWNSYVEQIYDLYVGDPIIKGDYFSCIMITDILTKDRVRVRTNEACVYKVKDGKIIIEQFYFTIQ